MRAIGEFIDAVSGFTTAIGYYDGICAYLYGVLAKEQAGGSTLPYKDYESKFNKAAEELAAYNRPFAQTIGSLIRFHFNHFRDSTHLSPESRAGRVSARYSLWIKSLRSSEPHPAGADELEALVTDWETEQILRWAIRPLRDLTKKTTDIEDFLKRTISEYDRAKLHILLGEIYAQTGDVNQALEYAGSLQNVPVFQEWRRSGSRC